MRAVVAWRTGQRPDDVVFDYRCAVCRGAHGKPIVRSVDGVQTVETSVSASGSVVLVAIADVPVGIDVERCAATAFGGFDSVALSEAERAAVGMVEPARRAELWVRKEAVLKISGIGLHISPSDLHVGTVLRGAIRVPDSVAVDGWASVEEVPVPDGYRAAVAIAGRVTPTVINYDGQPLLAVAAADVRTATA